MVARARGPAGRSSTPPWTCSASNPTASLGDIATAAEVGRSTLHRYFAERSDLLRALALHVHALSNAAIEHAEPDCGPPVEALRRVVECQLDLGPIVPFIYNEPTIVADPELAAELDTGDEAIVEVLDRVATPGHRRTAGLATTGVLGAAARRLRGRQAGARPRVQIVDAIMASLTEGTINPNQLDSRLSAST